MNDLTKYEEIRPYMRTFDRLEWRSETALGWAIRLITKQYVNHTGVVIRFKEYDRVFTSEALERGIDLNRLSDRLKTHKGECYWYPLRPEYEKYRITLGQKMLDWESVEYDYWSLLKQAVLRVGADASKLFCSEAVFLAGVFHDPPLEYPEVYQSKTPRPGEEMGLLDWWKLGRERLI